MTTPLPTTPQDQPSNSDGRSEVGMVRREQRLTVRTEKFPLERVRVVKRIVTEEKTITVMIRREEVTVIREPLDPNTPMDDAGHNCDKLPEYITLSEERPVVTMQIIPIERVHLRKSVATRQQIITGTVGREEIEFLTAVDR